VRCAWLVAVASLAGCAAPQTAQLVERGPAAVHARAELQSVPFFPQEAHQCGPAALATVLGAAGIDVSPESLTPEIYLPGREGSLAVELLAAARRHGLIAYRLAPRLGDVLREVGAGTPVLVLQNLSLPVLPQWHYAVVVGYDLSREEVVLRSGRTRRFVMTLSNFERTWARSGYWAMLALPPDRLPATATAERYVSAAVSLERLNVAAARRAYATALALWPDDLLAQLGAGNAAYAMGDMPAAESAYRHATRAHPDSADAWNNLAQVLIDRRRPREALGAARRAVALGGPRLPQYRETLRAAAPEQASPSPPAQ
jgi:Tetratricopeptide repeat/Peptidase_C39 like family